MGLIMHGGIAYGGGSDVVANPQDTATDNLEKVSIDGTVYDVTDADAVHSADVGEPNGVAELDENGILLSSQLPSYVDDVLEYASLSAFPATGESGKIYVALDTNLTYRWSGSAYVEISPSLALGETSSTAYRGDRGKAAYDHISRTDNPHSVTKAQVGLGNVGNFLAVSTAANQNLTDAQKKNARDNIGFDAAVESVAGVDSLDDNGVYLYRQSPANGTRALEEIVGGSVGWNQLIKNGDFADTNNWSIASNTITLTISDNVANCTVTNTQNPKGQLMQYFTVQNNHKYLAKAEIFSDTALTKIISFGGAKEKTVSGVANTWQTVEAVADLPSAGYGALRVGVVAENVGDTFKVRRVVMTDLTAMFGTAIANYAYTLETATAGSGIAWLKNQGFFTEDYYAYDSGSVQSVTVDRKEITWKNLCKYWKNAYINGSHDIVNNNDNVMCSPIRLLANKSYTISKGTAGTYGYCVYADKDFTQTIAYNGTVGNPTTLSYTTDCYLIAWFNVGGGSGSQATFDAKQPQIEIGSATAYEPYHKETITYDHSKTLRGIPKLVNNSIQYDGDVYRSDGSDEVKHKLVNLSDYGWNYDSGNKQFYSDVISDAANSTNVLCVRYIVADGNGNANPAPHTRGIIGNRIYIIDLNYTDSPSFIASLSGLQMQYELSVSTTESATPYTNPQKTAVGGTERMVDYLYEQGTRDVAVPVGHQTQYKKLPAEWDDDYMLYLQDKAENALQQGWHDSFAQLSDTSFSNLANGQIPKWNSTSQKWENANESGGGGLPAWTVLGGLGYNDDVELPATFSELLVVVANGDGYKDLLSSSIFIADVADFDVSAERFPVLQIPIYLQGSTMWSILEGSVSNNKRIYTLKGYQNSIAVIYYR